MIPILITGSTPEERRSQAYRRAAESMGVSADRLDSQPDFYLVAPDPSITIAQVRTLISHLSRKPFQSPVSVAILPEANLATIEAQNALLKTLEEPSPSSRIILTAPNKDILLPTVVSRCHELTLKPRLSEAADHKVQTDTVELLRFFLTVFPRKRLEKLDLLCLTKEESLVKLEELIGAAENQLVRTRVSSEQKKLAGFIRQADQARKYISANVNLRLALANFLLSF